MSLASALGAERSASWTSPAAHASRTRLFAVVGCVAAVNGFAGRIASSVHEQPLISALLDLGGVSAIVWFAIAALFALATEAPADRAARISRADAMVAGLTLALAFLPLNFAGALGLLLCGGYLALASPGGGTDRRIALIMLALTGPLIWGRFLLALVGPLLLQMDAGLAALLAGVPAEGNVVSLRGESGVLYVALGCSSVHNMSLAVLLFVAVTQLLRLDYTLPLLLTGVAAALAMAVVNVLRLATMARFPDYFDLIHTGWGGSAFGAASFVAAGAVIAWGVHAQLAR